MQINLKKAIMRSVLLMGGAGLTLFAIMLLSPSTFTPGEAIPQFLRYALVYILGMLMRDLINFGKKVLKSEMKPSRARALLGLIYFLLLIGSTAIGIYIAATYLF